MFKLVRIDVEDHQEIPLVDGKQVIGRANLPDCDDKRVSRNHAEVEILEDSIIIKALHTNPCFIKKNTMGEAHVIRQNSLMKLITGDKIGFTNDKFWFNIVNTERNAMCLSVQGIPSALHLIKNHKDFDALKFDDTTSEESSTDKRENKSIDEQDTNKTELEECEEPAASPSILTDELTQELQLDDNDIKTQKEKSIDNKIETEEQAEDCLSQSPGKRCLLKREPVSPVDIKKVKTEGNADDGLQCSGSGASTSGASSASSSSPAKDQARKRERCMYGAKCYRKNPQHKAQFCHPGDSDWGTGAQAPCPWGYACARRDPRHWRDHSHPYGMHPPPPAGKKKKRSKRNSSSDTPEEELIVTGKRARKTIQRETWSGSESEEDPYHTDDSDDWQPPSDVTDTQDYSQTSQII